VEGAEARQISITASCYGDVTILAAAEKDAEPHDFPCDRDVPANSVQGSLNLQFRNKAGQDQKETLRLFVAGTHAVTSSITMSLPPLPVIIGISVGGVPATLPPDGQGAPIMLVPGIPAQIVGIAFQGTEKAWIGSTSVPVINRTSRNILIDVPESLPPGVYDLRVENERGSSDPVRVEIRSQHPRLAIFHGQPKILCEGGPTIIPGKHVRIEGSGFLPKNTIWIGSTSATGVSTYGRVSRFYMEFETPESLTPGTYPIYVTNGYGKSNILTVTVSSPQ
jgi:hypothetical protein